MIQTKVKMSRLNMVLLPIGGGDEKWVQWRPYEAMVGGVMKKAHSFWVNQGLDHGSQWEVEMRDEYKQTEISVLESIGGNAR